MKTPVPRLLSTMTPFPYTIDVDDDVERARHMIDEHAFHHLPVTDGEAIAGIVHREDLDQARSGKVRDHVRSASLVVDIDTPLREVLTAMADRHIDVAVIMRHGRLAGVFTTTDACRAFAGLLETLAPGPGDDLVA